ncbi:MAG: phosphoenolpyruvate--protein phosphotransferase, partial [Deltaproteobacteria bacterium]
ALDGSTGEVVIDPDPATRADFEARRDAHLAAREAARAFRGKRVGVGDREVAVAANVGGTADLERAVDVAADGIGLFRTEFLFLDRDEAPTEEEQADIYRRAAAAFDQPVVIRTFDIGGDKPAPYLTAPTDEENPFLGVRGARLYPRERDLFADQVRAIVRATETGDPWLMLPMVSTLDEIRELMAVVDEIAADLIAREPGLRRPPVGVMVEVPSIALVADAVAEHVDFFSIGTNDLTQYTFAADRTNGALDHLQDPLHPAVLALCTFTRAAARRRGVSVSVCGLAAADPAGAALFAGMGIDKLSVAAASVNPIKATLSGLDPDRLGELVERCLAASSAAEVRALVGEVLESV